jgi:hypothetical protein
MTTNGTNGHPFPDRPAADVQPPAELSRSLFWEVRTSDGITESYEVTDAELAHELTRRGYVCASLGSLGNKVSDTVASLEAAINAHRNDHPDTERPPATEVESEEPPWTLPSKRVWEIHEVVTRGRDTREVTPLEALAIVASYLDEEATK